MNFLAANTPLDVSTGPLKDFATKVVNKDVEKVIDGWYLSPIFHSKQKTKNSGSDFGIAPMALNSVFRYFIQTSGLKLNKNEYLEKLGIQNLDRVYDVTGEDILDLTSALINAHVDAVKDNYIGGMNVNNYTFDITSFLVTSGFGYSTFSFLAQPIIKELAEISNEGNNSTIFASDPDSVSKQIREHLESYGETTDLARPEEMTLEALQQSLNSNKKNTEDWRSQQRRYANTFLYLKRIAENYRLALNVAQIDTKKFGKNSDEIIIFRQLVDKFKRFNVVFENPEVLYDKTFLGQKYENSVEGMFDMFGGSIIEFSDIYYNTANEIMGRYNKTGYFGKKFLRSLGPAIKSMLLQPFFHTWLNQRFPATGDKAKLTKLFRGSNSVAARFEKIRDLAYDNNIAKILFNDEIIKYDNNGSESDAPQFLLFSDKINNSDVLK